MVAFAGFSMPVQYTSIVKEHDAVRERAGLFDVSHMGQLHLEGPSAVASAEWLMSCEIASLRPGRVRYGMLCNEEGGVVDDVTVYRLADDALFLCVNAANIEKDRRHVEAHLKAETRLDDRSARTALIALQGPAAPAILASCSSGDPSALRRFRFETFSIAGVTALISRTGYTGSDGYELYLAEEDAEALWDQLLGAGNDAGLIPAGLGARDTLRLEAALPLYGHELDDTTSPLEAGLERFVKLERGGFLGAKALRRRASQPAERTLIGFEMRERGIARAEHRLFLDDDPVGKVTSGAPLASRGIAIGLAYVRPNCARPGTRLDVEIRQKRLAVEVVALPFVR